MSANDELQAHTCEKIMQEHGNVANEKVQDLTEAWENGELEWHKSYYCQNTKGDFCIATLMGADVLFSTELGATLNFGYWEVLAKVPSYGDCLINEALIKNLSKKVKKLIEEKDKLNERIEKLEELLKECKRQFEEVELYRYDVADTDQEDWFKISTEQVGIANKMIDKIDEALQ